MPGMLGAEIIGPISAEDRRVFLLNQKLRKQRINAVLGAASAARSPTRALSLPATSVVGHDGAVQVIEEDEQDAEPLMPARFSKRSLKISTYLAYFLFLLCGVTSTTLPHTHTRTRTTAHTHYRTRVLRCWVCCVDRVPDPVFVHHVCDRVLQGPLRTLHLPYHRGRYRATPAFLRLLSSLERLVNGWTPLGLTSSLPLVLRQRSTLHCCPYCCCSSNSIRSSTCGLGPPYVSPGALLLHTRGVNALVFSRLPPPSNRRVRRSPSACGSFQR